MCLSQTSSHRPILFSWLTLCARAASERGEFELMVCILPLVTSISSETLKYSLPGSTTCEQGEPSQSEHKEESPHRPGSYQVAFITHLCCFHVDKLTLWVKDDMPGGERFNRVVGELIAYKVHSLYNIDFDGQGLPHHGVGLAGANRASLPRTRYTCSFSL